MKSITSKIIFIFLLIFKLSKNQQKNEYSDLGYEKLLEWGLNNSLNITNKIKFVKDKDVKQYIAKNLIPEGEQIMDIPPEIMINVNRSLKLLNSKKFRKAYHDYIEEDKINTEVLKDDYHVDQSFMSYILYIVDHKKKTYEKNKFYQFYHPIFYMFENDLESLPFYYSSEQMRFFLNTSFGSIFEIFNRYINGEATIFEKKIFKKPVIFEDYLRYRIFSIQKSYDINGTINIVPFIDFIKNSFKNANCEFKIEDKHIKIKATHNIFPGEELIMKPITISNQHRFIFFGETFDEILDKFQSYNIPIMIPHFITDKPNAQDLSILGAHGNGRFDLAEFDFYSNVLNLYKKAARILKEDDSDYGALNLLLKYITKIRNNFNYISKDDIRKAFYKQRDIDNVQRIIEGEKKFLDKKIDILKMHMKNVKLRSEEKPDNSDVEDVNDL